MDTVIFDMDGVLVDSEPVIMRAAAEALAAEGIQAGYADFEPYIGAGEEKFITGPGRRAGKAEQIGAMMEMMYALYDKYVYQELKVYPSAPGLIRRLREAGYTLALVSSSNLNKLLVSLDAAGICKDSFDLILSGSDVTRKKPDPEPYQKAAAGLNRVPERCLVIEDAVSGVTAAKAAGMHCAAVTASFPAKPLLAAGADYIMDDIQEVWDILMSGQPRRGELD